MFRFVVCHKGSWKFQGAVWLCVAALALGVLLGDQVAAQPNLTGRWAPIGNSWGHMQIHLALMPGDGTYHSKLVSWQYGHHDQGSFWGWNPSSPDLVDCTTYPLTQFTRLSDATGLDLPDDLFCAGHVVLESGDLLIAGGHDKANDVGVKKSYLFRRNAVAGQEWLQRGSMAAGRWYPTNVTLPNGNAMTFSGTRFWHTVVFGGTDAPSNPTGTTRDEINRLGVTSAGEWQPTVTKPASVSSWPAPRESHTATWDKSLNSMLVFGGRANNASSVRNDVWKMEMAEPLFGPFTYTWSRCSGPLPTRGTRSLPREAQFRGDRDTPRSAGVRQAPPQKSGRLFTEVGT